MGLISFTSSSLDFQEGTILLSFSSIFQASASSSHSLRVIVFIATEHLLLLVYWAVQHWFSADMPEIARLRKWSEHFEPLWRKAAASSARTGMQWHLQRLLHDEHADDDDALRKLCKPLKTLTVPLGTRQGTRQKTLPLDDLNDPKLYISERTWKIDSSMSDPQKKGAGGRARSETTISSTSTPGAASEEERGPARVVTGTLSARHELTLPREVKRKLGITEDAVRYCWAYPPRAFAEPSGRVRGDELDINLELDLHDALRKKPPEDASDGAYVARRFIAVGGFMYFDKDHNLVQILTLVPGESGLSFSKSVVSDPNSSSLEERLVQQVGRRLRERGDFVAPTLPPFVNNGVIGFCWVTPRELFRGLRKKKKQEEQEQEDEASALVTLNFADAVAESDAADRAKIKKARLDDEKLAEWLAFRCWPSGAFVYMFEKEGDEKHLSGEDARDEKRGRWCFYALDRKKSDTLVHYDDLLAMLRRLQRRYRTYRARRASAAALASAASAAAASRAAADHRPDEMQLVRVAAVQTDISDVLWPLTASAPPAAPAADSPASRLSRQVSAHL